MRKLKLFMAALALTGWGNFVLAQTDVTSTYIQNADFSKGTPVSSNVYGYAHDALGVSETTPYGLQDVTDWTAMPTGVTDGDAPAQGIENVAAMGAIFEYGSEYKMQGNGTTPPSTGPDGGAGTCLGIAGVWGAKAQYYQDVTLPAGKYVFTVTYYSKSGTQNNTSLFGFIEDGGASHVVACNPATGEWKTASVTFTLIENTSGKISVGYKSTGNGSGANPHLYVDNIKLTKDDITAPTLPLRADFGGSSVDLNDFVVGNGDYTLEVQGTVGTPIVIAADNINYTPTTSGEVRFVKYDGVIYVYEDGFYITTAKSSKATASFTDITGANVTTSESNLLANPSFETLGSSVGSNIYNIGTPWTSNVTMMDKGIRVGTNSNATNGNYVLVWRGSGNNNYITQPLTTLKPLHQYQVKMQQVASGNANANFNVGIGSAEGEYTLSSTTVRLGTSNDGIKAITFDAPSNIVEGGTYYFTFRNTSNNTASKGNDPVTQIDWISLVCQNALVITGATSAVYLDGTAYAPTSAKEAYETLLSEAEETIAHTDYVNVTGSERTSLQAAIDVEVADNKEAYNAATLSLSAALDAFKDAKAAYDGYVTFVGGISVPNLAYASAEKKTAIDNAVAATPASASDVEAKESAITTALRAYYESHALAEGVAGAVNMTDKIVNANDPKNNEGWTWTGSKNNPANNESWTDSNGTKNHSYFDGGNWNGTSWTTTMEQTIELPAGKYLLTAKGRAMTSTTLTLSVGEVNVALPHIGSTGNVFDRGWGDASLEFTTDGTAATIKVTATAEPTHEWFSVCDFRLVQLEFYSDAYASTTADYADMNTAITNAEAMTLGFEVGEYAPYVNANALKALAEAKAMDQTAVNTNLKNTIASLVEAMNNRTANTAEVNAVNTALFTSGDVTGTGWTQTQTWGQVKEDVYSTSNGTFTYGEVAGFEMPLKANTVYKLTFNHRAWDGNNSENGGTVSVLCGEDGLAATSFTGQGTNTTPKTETFYFKTGAAGNYVFTLNATSGRPTFGGVTILKAVAEDITISEEATDAPTASEYANVTLERGFNKGWNAVCLPFATPAFDGAEIAEFDGEEANDNAVTLKFKKVDAFEANKPYLVYFPNAVASGKRFEGVAVAPADVKAEGTAFDFMGTYTVQNIAAGDYVVSGGALKKASGAISLKATRTYFTPKTSNARIAGFTIDGNVVTGISTIFTDEANTTEGIYNLQGQKVNGKAQKGIYIVNGKKVIK